MCNYLTVRLGSRLPCFWKGSEEEESVGYGEWGLSSKRIEAISDCSLQLIHLAAYVKENIFGLFKKSTWIYECALKTGKVLPFIRLSFLVNLYFIVNHLNEVWGDKMMDVRDLAIETVNAILAMGDLIFRIIEDLVEMELITGQLLRFLTPFQILHIATAICGAVSNGRDYYMTSWFLREFKRAETLADLVDLFEDSQYQLVIKKTFGDSGREFVELKPFKAMLKSFAGITQKEECLLDRATLERTLLPRGGYNLGDFPLDSLKSRITSEISCYKVNMIANSINTVASILLIFGPLIITACPPLLVLAPHLAIGCHLAGTFSIMLTLSKIAEQYFDSVHFDNLWHRKCEEDKPILGIVTLKSEGDDLLGGAVAEFKGSDKRINLQRLVPKGTSPATV